LGFEAVWADRPLGHMVTRASNEQNNVCKGFITNLHG
jgi:hypothetical protein